MSPACDPAPASWLIRACSLPATTRTTWYLFLLLVLLPSLAITKGISKFRAGLIGLLGPLIMLLMNTANTFLYFNGRTLQGERGGTAAALSIAAQLACPA